MTSSVVPALLAVVLQDETSVSFQIGGPETSGPRNVVLRRNLLVGVSLLCACARFVGLQGFRQHAAVLGIVGIVSRLIAVRIDDIGGFIADLRQFRGAGLGRTRRWRKMSRRRISPSRSSGPDLSDIHTEKSNLLFPGCRTSVTAVWPHSEKVAVTFDSMTRSPSPSMKPEPSDCCVTPSSGAVDTAPVVGPSHLQLPVPVKV